MKGSGASLTGPKPMRTTNMQSSKETRFGGTGNGGYTPGLTPGAKMPEGNKPSAVTTKNPY